MVRQFELADLSQDHVTVPLIKKIEIMLGILSVQYSAVHSFQMRYIPI